MTYIGSRNDPNRTLHINQPNGCKCQTAKNIQSADAIYWSDLVSAHESGYVDHCNACRTAGEKICRILLPTGNH
jgi:hypothetical protein